MMSRNLCQQIGAVIHSSLFIKLLDMSTKQDSRIDKLVIKQIATVDEDPALLLHKLPPETVKSMIKGLYSKKYSILNGVGNRPYEEKFYESSSAQSEEFDSVGT